ncbi:hypothetical protein ACFQ69_36490 [Streptomyces sp. NPDC056470]|uniref:hypothetical protein n=1 Tax=Streptomyces sp. NPDC056470 TaxID=3345831 RepID=UPI0036D00F5B
MGVVSVPGVDHCRWRPGLYVDDESAAPHAIGTEEFGAAWPTYEKGRHQMIVPTGQATSAPDIDGAIAATTGHLTGPVLGNNFDVNFGFSGMEKLAAQLRDTRTKTGWERRFGDRGTGKSAVTSRKRGASRPATCGGVALGDVSGDRVDTGTGVPLQGTDGGVPESGQQHGGGGAALRVVCQGAVA